MAFKLKPLSLSSDLIGQLKAMALKLGEKAEVLQKLVTQGKNKNKHYKGETQEVGDFKKDSSRVGLEYVTYDCISSKSCH